MAYVGKIKDSSGTTGLVGSTLYGTCTTAAGTAAKVVTLADFDKLVDGVTIHVYFTNSNTASSPTLNVNSTGAKAIRRYGSTSPGTSEGTSWITGATVSFTYDGTNDCWRMNDPMLNCIPNTAAGLNAALNLLTPGSSTPSDADWYISQFANGGTTTTSFHRRPVSALWLYMKSKMSAGTGISFSTDSTTNVMTINHSNSITAVTTAGLLKVKYDAQGHITGSSSITKSDITGLGIPDSDTKVTVSTISDDSTDTWYRPTFAASAGTDGLNIIDSYRIHHVPGTTTDIGTTQLSLGNNIASGDVGNKRGLLSLYSTGSGYTSLKYDDDVTDNTVQTLPSITGVVLNSGTTSFTQSLSSGTKIGTIKINNVSTDIYAPSASTPITYTLSGAYGGTNNSTWVSTLTPSSGTSSTSTVPTASTSVYGITKLSSATNSTSTSLAATASAVKSAYDLAGGKSTVSFTRSLSSGTKIGSITIDGTSTDIYCQTNSDTKVTSTKLAASTAAANYLPTFVSDAGTSGVNIIDTFGVRHTPGTTTSIGNTRLVLGNATASGTANNEEGYLLLYGPGTGYATLHYADASVNSANTLPSTGGTILNTGTTSVTQTLTSGTKIGSITIDGTSTDLFAPSPSTPITYTLSGAYGTSGNTWITTLTPSSGTTTTSTVPTASTSVYGITKLSSATNSTSTALAATASAVKSAYDLASGKSAVSFTQSLSSGTKIGTITIDGTGTDIYCQTNTDTTVTSTEIAASAAAANYMPTFVSAAGTSGVNIISSFGVRHTPGTTSAVGNTRLVLGNATASGSANNEEGYLLIYGPGTGYATLHYAEAAVNSNNTLPSTGGTLLNTGTTSFTQTLSSGTKIGSIKIDGDSTDIYAPDNTDTKVTQTVSSDNKNFPLLLSYYESSSTTATAQTTNRSNSIYANPSTGLISSAGIIPNTAGTFASGANGSIGTASYSFASSYVKTSNTETENTGTINISNVAQLTRASGDTFFRALRSDTSTEVGVGVNSGGTNHGLFSFTLNQWLIYSNGTYNYIRSNIYRPTSTATGYAIPILGSTPSTGAKVMYNSEGLRFTTLGGTTSVEGIAKLLLGNGVAKGSANNMTGSIRMYGSSTSYGDLSCDSGVSTESWVLPAKSGTIAIVDRQPVIYSARITASSGNITVSNATYDWTKYSLLMMTIQAASSQMWNSFMIPWIWARANVDSGTYWRPSELESINDTAFITDCTDTGFTMGFQTGSWDAPFNISIIGII